MPTRQHNLIAPKGAGRARPQYLLRSADGADVWLYRGREILISADARGGWWADFNVVDPVVQQRMMDAGVQYDIAGLGPAPDEQAALKYAAFTIDAHERLAEPGTHARLAAVGVVRDAIQELAYSRSASITGKIKTPTRAEVARLIARYTKRRPPEVDRHELEAFNTMPAADRVELIDELLEIADAWGGRYPNPDRADKAWLLRF